MLEKISYNFRAALESIGQNKLRAFLTSLGIIFGVASVISMMAIGRGAREAVLQQLATLGSHNILVISKVPDAGEEQAAENETSRKTQKRFTPGLTVRDAQAIDSIIPGVEIACPEVSKELSVLYQDKRTQARLTGITNDFFDFAGLTLENGYTFTARQAEMAEPVCIIGRDLKNKLFPSQNPINKKIKCGKNWFTVVGVAGSRTISGNSSDLKMHDFRMEVFIPLKSFLMRVQDRSRVTIEQMEQMFFMSFGDDGQSQPQAKNYHQVDKITVVVEDSRQINQVAETVKRMLERRHNKNTDFEVIVPEMLLKQEQETQQTFNLVLILLASISLLVGGIGIMNIMLASVMERIREIGVRLALGATRRDIVLQFLSEAVTISIIGGIIGIIVGLVACRIISQQADILTIVTPFSVILSFLVSVTVGILFGIFPARRAAYQDPVVSLRHE